MTNSPGNNGNNGIRCAICKASIKGYLQWLCPKHRTKEFAAIANKAQASKDQSVHAVVISHSTFDNLPSDADLRAQVAANRKGQS